MPNLVTDDEDELELEDEQKRRAAQQGTIGQMPRPTPSTSSVPPAMAPPDVGASSQTPPTISGAAPFKTSNPEVAAPRPAQQAYQDWESQDLAKHPVGKPRYNLAGTIGDTIAGAVGLEKYGEFGTTGAEAKRERLAKAAGTEEEQIKGGQQERQANAQLEETQGKIAGEEAGNELVDVPLPGGGTTQVMRKNVATPTAAIINTSGRENVAKTNAEGREGVADINAGAREQTARIMVGGKALGTKEIHGADGKDHIMMWNPTTHTYDKDLGEAPPKQAASSPYANTRTVQLLDPESGIPTVYQYNAQTNSYDKPVGTSATGAYGHEMAQAGAVERAGTDLVKEIQANKEKIGDAGALWNAAFMGTPLSDPYQSGLAARLASFAALNPALHGARGAAAMKEFERIYGSPINNPDSLIAAIEAGMKTAGAINPTRKGSTSSQGAAGGGVSAPPPTFGEFSRGTH